MRVKHFSVQLLQVVLLLREVTVMLESARFTDKDAVIGDYIRCFVFHTVNTVLVEFVVCHEDLEKG